MDLTQIKKISQLLNGFAGEETDKVVKKLLSTDDAMRPVDLEKELQIDYRTIASSIKFLKKFDLIESVEGKDGRCSYYKIKKEIVLQVYDCALKISYLFNKKK